MTAYWQHIIPEFDYLVPGSTLKNENDILFALWYRCDACSHVGPIGESQVWERGFEQNHLCVVCHEKAEVREILQSDGWVWIK